MLNYNVTGMHSSRMRTARSSSRPGGGVPGRDQAPPRDQVPPLWTDTPVNILPCPKLRLRVVIII